MIYVTVGTQLAFDRLITAVDRWAGTSGEQVIAQIGPSALVPDHLQYRDFLSCSESQEMIAAARLVVAHAGMGSIISALQAGKPIVILPRLARLGEHRNEHQLATAHRFQGRPGVTVLEDADALGAVLDNLLQANPAPPALRDRADDHLLSYLSHVAEDRMLPTVPPTTASAARPSFRHRLNVWRLLHKPCLTASPNSPA